MDSLKNVGRAESYVVNSETLTGISIDDATTSTILYDPRLSFMN